MPLPVLKGMIAISRLRFPMVFRDATLMPLPVRPCGLRVKIINTAQATVWGTFCRLREGPQNLSRRSTFHLSLV